MASYREFFYAPNPPVNIGIAPPIKAFAAEPFYQLLRYQLLAQRVGFCEVDMIDSTSVLCVYVPENRGLRNVIIPEFLPIGNELFEAWTSILADSDRFAGIPVKYCLNQCWNSRQGPSRQG